MTRHASRGGTVLLAVLLVTALSAMVAASLLYYMQSQVYASASGSKGEQAYAAAMSGIQQSLAAMRTPEVDHNDNPEMFSNQLVCDDGANKWYFTVYAPMGDGKTLRYGLEDESGKINLNTASDATIKAMMASLKQTDVDPNALADCFLDYRDRDATPREAGAEQDYYDKLKFPYVIKNGPLGTLEELLLIKGFSARVVYGEDANLNGILDPNEDDGDKSFPPDAADGELDRGLTALATVVTHEPNVDKDGKARIFINGADTDLAKLGSVGLPKETVDFIKTCRADGVTFTHPSQLLSMSHTTTPKPKNGAPATVPAGGQTVTITSGVTPEALAIVMDKLTTLPGGNKTQLPGMVNVNTAEEGVLRLLPGFDENLARSIVQSRGALDADKKSTIAWLFTENLVDAKKFKEIAPTLTTRSLQFRLHCIGFGVPCGRFRVVEAILDFAGSTPRITYLRDITRLGPPMAMDPDSKEHRQ